ncbi:hypothetical protein, partial [Rhodocyclus purpureus]|uniref:hypothetical protein n=1 Tax=Rhodocyclus purpureus TaxID=1067 RepID=UPI001A93A769
ALYSSSEKVACMVGHEREAGRHYLKERLPTAGVGWFRLNQCFPNEPVLPTQNSKDANLFQGARQKNEAQSLVYALHLTFSTD